MGRARFAPPVIDDAPVAAPGDLPRPSFGRAATNHTRQASYQRFTLGRGGEQGGASHEAGFTECSAPGPAANDMGPGPELDALRERARQEGLERGLAEGRQLAENESAALLSRYRSALTQLETLEADIVDHYRAALTEVAIGVAEAVIQREVSEPQTVASLAGQALEAFGRDVREFELTLSPHDAELLEPWLESRRASGIEVKVHVDTDASPGDMKARCPGGALETTLHERLERATRAIRGDDPSPAGDP